MGLLVGLVAIPVIAIWHFQSSDSNKRQLTGVKLPLITVSTSNGKIFSIDMKGTKLALVFFNVECSSCIEELTCMNILYNDFKHEVDFYGISLSMPANTNQLLSSNKYSFPIFQGATPALQDSIKIYGIPTILFVDEQGIIRYKYAGYHTAKQMKKLLQEFTNKSFIQ